LGESRWGRRRLVTVKGEKIEERQRGGSLETREKVRDEEIVMMGKGPGQTRGERKLFFYRDAGTRKGE